MRILQLTDTHLYGDSDRRHYDRIDTTAALRAVLERLRDLEGIDLVLHTGDASDDGSVDSYRLLHELLDPFAADLGAQLAVTMGNHDLPAEYAKVAGVGDHGGPWQDRLVEVPGRDGAPVARVIVLDSTVPGAGYGHLDAEQLDWLRDVLAGGHRATSGVESGSAGEAGAHASSAGTVLAIHHPPLGAPTALLQGLRLDNPDELAEVLTGSDVRVVLSGHYHHEMDGSIAGIPVHVAPGITNVTDPVGPPENERAVALSGASIIEIDPSGEAGAGGASGAVTSWTSIWPNAGDTRHAPDAPVYDFDPATVQQILEAAGR